jgi:phosphoglycolate phosphatase
VSPLVVFDLDGTLFRTDRVTVPAVQRAFERHGLDVPSPAEVCAFIGKPDADLHAWIRSRFPAGVIEDVIRSIDRDEMEGIATTGELYPGVEETLEMLSRRVAHMAICSNGPRHYVERVLSVQGIADRFEMVRSRLPSDEGKAEMVRDVVDRFGAPHSVVVGDRREDVDAARKNEAKSIAATYGYGAPEELAGADVFAGSPREIVGLVRDLLG